MKQIMKCGACGAYTLEKEHCGEATSTAHPPKYSPEDKWAKYRRKAKGLGE